TGWPSRAPAAASRNQCVAAPTAAPAPPPTAAPTSGLKPATAPSRAPPPAPIAPSVAMARPRGLSHPPSAAAATRPRTMVAAFSMVKLQRTLAVTEPDRLEDVPQQFSGITPKKRQGRPPSKKGLPSHEATEGAKSGPNRMRDVTTCRMYKHHPE